VFFETLRFSAILAASGQNRWEAAVDLQVLQKVLPRLHGSRRRLESTLRILASFCYSEDPPNPDFEPEGDLKQAPRFPLSFDKLRRMTRRLRANQFVSFAE
jgi:5-methylcytosine-specific restriction protein B